MKIFTNHPLIFCFISSSVLCVPVLPAHAVTVVNSVWVESVTGGGQSRAGLPGQDGAPGAAGTPGADGQDSFSGVSRVSVRSAIDGVTVVSGDESDGQQYMSSDTPHEFRVGTSSVLHSDSASVVSISATGTGTLMTPVTFSDQQLQEWITTIHKLLLSYVSLFL